MYRDLTPIPFEFCQSKLQRGEHLNHICGIEQIFAIPGIGKFFVQSVLDRDYPFIMGITIFYAVLLMASRFLADLAYALVDPRLRLQAGRVAK
ncbi:ABC transporter permease subunit [Cohnella xylanilytica]|uniref:ABC transporter permease subunit n=1 Tax=Cohnella xylanilytica TaxID=557555 RepID=UPI0035712903